MKFRGPVDLDETLVTYMNIGVAYHFAKPSQLNEQQSSAIGDYLTHLAEAVTDGVGVFLYGDNSFGKTHIASILCKEVWRRLGVASYCVTAAELRKCWTSDPNKLADSNANCEELMSRRVEKVRFLVIDDIGKEYRTSSSDYFESNFGELLRLRRKHGLTTSFTANVSRAEFAKIYGKSTDELLVECTTEILLAGQNMRSEKARDFGPYAKGEK